MDKKLFTDLKEKNPFTKLYTWKSPERHWFPKDRSWYISYSLFFVILIAFLALIGEFILIILVLAFVFLWFAQGATPPETIEHTITSLGIRTFDTFYKWRNIKHFWFSHKSGITYLQLETFDDAKPDFIKRVSLLVNENGDEEIFPVLVKYVDYGDEKEIGYNIFMSVINGEYFNQNRYLKESSDEYPFEEV